MFSSDEFASSIVSSYNLIDCMCVMCIHVMLYVILLYYIYKLCEINCLPLLLSPHGTHLLLAHRRKAKLADYSKSRAHDNSVSSPQL